MLQITPLLPRISDYVAWHAARQPHSEAIVLGDQRWSYSELSARVDQLAAALLSVGVRKGDRVATLQTPHPDFVVSLLATTSIGGIWVGLNPKYQIAELQHVILDCTPKVVITRTRVRDRLYASELAAIRATATGIEHLVVFDGDPLVSDSIYMCAFLVQGRAAVPTELAAARDSAGGRDPCLIVYTSGSSGKPKGALLHHEAIAAFSIEQNRLWATKPHRVLNYFPINHIGSVVDITIPAIAAGGTLIMMEHFDPRGSLQLMEQERVTIWASVPSIFQMQLALPEFGQQDLSAVQLIIWEGAAMPSATIRRLAEICPRLATNYSMTEALGITVTNPSDDVEMLAVSVGTPFPGVELRLMNDGVEAVGNQGEIWVRSRYTLLGYWNRPEATDEAITQEGFFKTGDLAVRSPDDHYRIVGRLSEMFKSGGYNVYPREVEAVLEDHPAVAAAAVVAVADPIWQEVGVAYIVRRCDVTPAALETHCRARLANYKVPKRFVVEDDLPLLPIGKVDKSALRARASEHR